MNAEWNELNKSFQSLIIKKETFQEGKNKLLQLRKSLYDMVMTVRGGFNPKGYHLAPLSKSKGFDSKTMAYSIYHLARIEDIVCHSLLKNDEQIFNRNNYQKRLKINIKTTGNELKGNEIISFSKQIALNELFSYFTDVYLESNEFINNLEFQDLKTKISEDKKQYLYDTDYVSKDEDAIWLIDYWCNKNTLGLLKMPFSRHWIMHIEVFLKIKNEIVRKAKKENKNKIAVCGFSCSHCFLGEWCGGCRTEYNCCSFGTLFEGGICPNVKCAREKEIEGCYDCSLLDTCEKGFYVSTNNGAGAAKASAMFIHKYGKKEFVETLNKMHQKYDFAKMQEILGNNPLNGLLILEKFKNDEEVKI